MAVIATAQCIFPFWTGIPRDVISNTTHWEWSEATSDKETIADEIAARLEGFYTNALFNFQANYVDWSAATCEVFWGDEAPPRIPMVRDIGTSPTAAASAIPTEVACVLSYHAAPESGVDRRRLHNRFYIGGLSTAAMDASTTTSFPIFDPTFLTQVAAAATNLLSLNTAELQWRQRSDAGAITTMRDIVGGWVDNSPDTQRRRSVDASSRTSWS